MFFNLLDSTFRFKKIQNGGQVNLINFYKPDSCPARKMPSETPGAILLARKKSKFAGLQIQQV